MIKAVLFDFDGVLTRDKTGSLTTLRYLSLQTGIGFDPLREAFKPYNQALNLGQTTHADIWPSLCNTLGQQIDIALLRAAFESTPMNEGMFTLARALKNRYAVGIVTDNKQDRMAHLKQHLNLALCFDPIVVSAEVGSSKESAAIFEHALSEFGIAAHESLFIDNSPGNLIAPAALGMKTLLHDDESNDIDALVDAMQATCEVSTSACRIDRPR